MKKLLLIMIAALALSCESRNQSTDPGAGSELEEKSPPDPVESDTSSIRSDTTDRTQNQ
jgi:hypothetical protein